MSSDFVGDDVICNNFSASQRADIANGVQLELSVHMTEDEIVNNNNICDYPEPVVFRPSSTALDRARLWWRAGVEQDISTLLELVQSVDPSRDDVVSMVSERTRETIARVKQLLALE